MRPTLAVTAAAAALAGCASMSADGGVPAAPQPLHPVASEQFYSGVWHELARNPMKLTDGCVAGETRFYRGDGGRLIDRDSCREGSPQGKEKVYAGPVTLLDPPVDAKFRTHYRVFGPITVSREYWVLDHGDDWFIVASPSFKDLSIFTRDPNPGRPRLDQLVARAKAMGYDTARLEYPPQPSSPP